MTLIEMVGVMAVICILALALVPVLSQQIQAAARTEEQRRLARIGSAFESAALRTRRVPAPADLAAWLATELGWTTDDVSTNPRGRRRAYLVDPRLRLGLTPGASLPYIQDSNGSSAPVAPRILVVSSLSTPLPDSIQDSSPTTAQDFDQLWSGTPGTVPSSWSWSGLSADLFVQRIDMAAWWVPVVLNNQSAVAGSYGADDGATNIMTSSVQLAWFLRGTLLRLHGESGELQTRQVIQDPESFSYENRVWRGRIFAGVPARDVVGVDVQFASERFLASPHNPAAKPESDPTSPQDVLEAFAIYMQSYASWQAAGFSRQAGSPAFNAMKSAQAQMSSAVANLIFKTN